MTEKPTAHKPGPIELYILTAGLLLGILLGPAVLGRVAPQAHASLFGGGPATQQLLEYEQETAAMIATLEATGVTPDAIPEQLELRALQADAIRQGRDAVMDRNTSTKLLIALLLLIATVAGEAALGQGGRVWIWARYVFAAAGLALVVARPRLIFDLPSAFGF